MPSNTVPGMDLPERFTHQTDQYEAWQRDTIRRHGWALQAVLGDEESPPFVYTVGLAGFRHAELILFATTQATAAAVLNANRQIGALVGVIVLVELLLVVTAWAISPGVLAQQAGVPIDPTITNTQALGMVLYTRYVYFFEGAGLVLLALISVACSGGGQPSGGTQGGSSTGGGTSAGGSSTTAGSGGVG